MGNLKEFVLFLITCLGQCDGDYTGSRPFKCPAPPGNVT